MTDRTSRWLALAAILVVTACGGGGTATNAPGGATQAPGQQATVPPAATQATAATPGGGGGTFSGNVCELVTIAEVEAIVGITGVKTTETPINNGSGGCLYLTADAPVAATTLVLPPNGQAGYDAVKADPAAVAIQGVGDGAFWAPAVETLYAIKGGTAFGVQAGFHVAAEQRKAWATEIAKKIASRL